MAYAKFYKAGIKQIYTNTRLLYPSSSSLSSSSSSSSPTITTSSKPNNGNNNDPPPPVAPAPGTRSHHLLRRRWLHDIRRLPLFAIVLIVCGECTPLVVLAFPRAVPLTCRIPKQVDKLLAQDEARRAEARTAAAAAAAAATTNAADVGASAAPLLAKALGLPARPWTPAFLLRRRVDARLAFLARDDALLADAGGPAALEPAEARLACADRGIDVLGRGDDELRRALGRWLRATQHAQRTGGEGRRREVMARLLLAGEAEWEV
ncbi:hypothetical protein VTJ83DRAFT_3223 [Remersonia thermophila]|uniref:Letm1 RBD domain-containing protein n=1 Tax=Remersonia thermophila TaxID=72144 RepID=A0ABR4DDP7_9PEZI